MKCRTVGVLVALLSSAAACGSNATVSGGTEPALATTVSASDSTTSTTVSTTVPETSAPETTSPETTSPETTTTVALVDPRLVVTPIDVAAQCSDTSCVSVAVTLAGEVVWFDSATRVVTFAESGRTVAVDPSVDGPWSLVLMGPDDVAYVMSVPDGSTGETLELVAIPTVGPLAGLEVARVGGLDPSGDSNLIATAKGVMQVGCCGFDDRSPRADTPLTMAWVTSAGEPSGVVLPDVHLEYPDDDSTVVVRTDPDDSERRWTVPTMLAGRDMPPVVATDDGGALLFFYDYLGSPETPALLYEFRPDGTVDTFQVGQYQYAAAVHSARFIVVFDGAYVRLSLP